VLPENPQCPITSALSSDNTFQQNAHACIVVCSDVMTWYCRGEGILQGFESIVQESVHTGLATFGLGISLNSLETFAIVNQDAYIKRVF
jgi:hypothetical protein